MVLRAGYIAVAAKLQEAADMMHGDVRARLQDAVQDAHRGTGKWGNYIDHSGDGESGDVIYSCDGDVRKAPYEIGSQGGKATANIDMDNSTNVVPMTTYQEEADDDDYMSSMEESFKSAGLYSEMPLYERFISKKERDGADESDFAGKGKSYPILKPEDVPAAVHAMGRAGDKNVGMSTLKSRIIAIAKRKGWTKYLPKTWRGDSSGDAKESAIVPRETGALKLVESMDWAQEEALTLMESAGTIEKEIKIIKPGAGSSAIYPAEVLKRDGPKVFTKGTHMYINHATEAEKKARPEGDWNKLAGSLSTDAYWKENDKRGEGLYAMATFAPDMATAVIAKAPWSGVSINANGHARMEAGRPVIKNGLPELACFTSCESIDIVTRAGAGGMILTEAARPGNSQEVDMTKEEIAAIVKVAVSEAVAAIQAPVKTLESRALRGDAMVEAGRILSPYNLRESAKAMVVENVLRFGELPTKDGDLDSTKFGELVTAEAKRVAAGIGYDGVTGMGSGLPVFAEPKSEKKLLKEAKRARELAELQQVDALNVFESLGMPKEAAQFAAKGRAA